MSEATTLTRTEPASLTLLVPDFREAVERVLEESRNRGHTLVPFFTVKTPQLQASLWRKSRAAPEIRAAVETLKREGAPFLAQCIEEAVPRSGRWETNQLPGQSWHQWGEAVDCVVQESGRNIWGAGHPGYRAYAEAAVAEGLTAGYFWKRKDVYQIQMRPHSVRAVSTWPEIDAEMRRRFG